MNVGRSYIYALSYPESMGGYVFYIGKGTGDRVHEHEREAKRSTPARGQNKYKVAIIRKIWENGEQIVKTKLAFFEMDETAFLYEQALIFLMKPYGHLTNLTDGGEGLCGLLRTEEHRRKIGKAHKGRIKSEETRRKISLAKKGHTPSQEQLEHLHKLHKASRGRTHSEEELHKMRLAHKGKTHSEESRRKMSLAQKGRPPASEDYRQKMSEATRGKPKSEEHRRKMSLGNKGQVPHNRGKPNSEETRRKIGEANKRRAARRREQALLAMRYPVISSTDAEWKQDVQALSLWDDNSGWPCEVRASQVMSHHTL